MRDRLDDEIRATIADQCRRAAGDIAPATSVFRELAPDSLAVVEMIMALERRFGVTIQDADIERLETVADLTAYIRERCPGSQPHT